MRTARLPSVCYMLQKPDVSIIGEDPQVDKSEQIYTNGHQMSLPGVGQGGRSRI